jgi:hypothetical protein
MWIPSDPERFTSKFKYVEFARYIEDAFPIKDKADPDTVVGWRPGVIRKVKVHNRNTPDEYKEPLLFTWQQIEGFAERNDYTGIYTSVFQYDKPVMKAAQSMANLYFDLDHENLAVAHDQARRLYSHLTGIVPEQDIRIYFTGKKGFHIECEAITLGIGPSGDLADVFRLAANDLKETLTLQALDFAVYDSRRMWRMPNTKHQTTGLYKIPLEPAELFNSADTILGLAESPRNCPVREPVFDPAANEWFREYTYEAQKPSLTQEEMMERFAKFGTGMTRDVGETQFDPERLFTHCKAMDRLWKKAEREQHLEHEERLFLCSILTYSDQAIEYLHAILRNCADYNEAKSESHIRDWIRRRELGIGGRPYSCARANSAGVGCGDCELEAKEKWQVVGDKMVPTGEKAQPSPVRFAYSRKEKQ